MSARTETGRRRASQWAIAALLATLSPAPIHAAGPAISISDLVEVTDVDGLSVSPDGRFAIFRTVRADVGRNSYMLRWHCADLADGAVRDIGSGGQPIYLDPGSVQSETPLWSSDNRSVIVRALIDGAIGLWRIDVAGGAMAPLVAGDADVLSYGMTPDRTAVLYETGATRDAIRRAEEREYDEGILFDSTVDPAQNLFRGGSVNGRMASQRLVGYWFVKDGLLWRTPRQQRRLDLATGRDVAVGEPKPVPPFTLPKWPPPLSSTDAAGNIAAARQEDGKGSITATLAGGRTVICADPLCASARPSSLVWRPGFDELLITFADREMRQSLYLWDIRSNRLRKVAGEQGLLNGGRRGMIPCALSKTAAICVASGAASPPRVVQIDLGSGKRRLLFDPNSALRSAYRPRVRFLRWGLGEGREATAVLMQPSSSVATPAPLYINYYLCEGFLRGGEGDEWPIPQLLGAGYAVACINSVPFKGAQDAVHNYEVGLEAVGSLIDKLSEEGIADRTKVAMGGLSFGSEVAMWVAFHSDLLAALSITSPQPEYAGYWFESTPGSDQAATVRKVWGYGAPDETPARWRKVSPALNADRIRTPVLFQMPELEARRVPELYARLSRGGTPTELYAFPDEGHIKVQPRHRLAAYERNLDWFRYWLEGYRDPDQRKDAQYRRWDELRRGRRDSSTSAATVRAQPSR